jgi:endonuclease/exonuclease/phosphatase family metal-dependent hydrolase
MQTLNKILAVLIVMCAGFIARAQTTILDETLLTPASFNSFTAVNVTGTQVWNHSTQYGAVCSGFSAGQSYANEDWLISPPMNLAQMENVQLSFAHTRGNAAVMNVGVELGWYKAFATANYTGDPATTQWVELTGLNQNITNAWTYISSGALSIPAAAMSANTRIAFRYQCSASQSATWEIKNVKVTGEPVTAPGTAVFKVTNWNTEWLGCTQFGPTDEAQQLNNVAAAMLAMNSDVYCIQEVSNTPSMPTIASLVALLGSDEWEAKLVPATTDDCDQWQAIVYKKSKVQFVSMGLFSNGISAQGNSYHYNWSSGRFPAVYEVNFKAGTTLIPVTIVNIHAKAEDGNAMSYTRRKGASEGLKAILDGAAYNSRNVILTGDFNDFLTGTNSNACACVDSPYKNFMDDTADYTALTANITDANWSRPLIEHFIVSNELADNYIANSAVQEVTMPPAIPGYYNNTSNHLPLTARFTFTATAGTDDFSYQNTWSVYPNPVKDVLTVTSTEELNGSAIIYDVTGRQVYNSQLSSNSINVSQLPAGMYIIKIGNASRKFVKE